MNTSNENSENFNLSASVPLDPIIIRARDEILEQYSDKSLEEQITFYKAIIEGEKDSVTRLSAMAARVYVLRKRLALLGGNSPEQNFDEESNIDILSAGTIPSNPQELLADKGFEELITKLKSEYKYVGVDTAPTQAVSDSMIVANSCDSVIYVVRADSTSDKVINNGLSRFLQVGHRLDGVVLNQVNLRKSDVAQRYAGFYDQYGYTSQKSS